MTKAALENAIRDEILAVITKALEEHFQTDVLDVSTSELTVPCLDAEQNEKFGLIKVTIPRGSRNGEGGYDAYDGYAEHEAWEAEKAARLDKKVKAQEAKERAEKEKERKRAAKKVVKDLNAVGFKALVTQPVEQEEVTV